MHPSDLSDHWLEIIVHSKVGYQGDRFDLSARETERWKVFLAEDNWSLMKAGLYISLEVLPSWADPGSCSPSAHVMIFWPSVCASVRRVFWVTWFWVTWLFWFMDRVFLVTWLILSMFSQLTPCSTIQDGRMAQLVEIPSCRALY